MKNEVRVPALPESVADATLAEWHKKEGDFVKRDENLIDLETDKVVLEVPSPIDGVLKIIHQHNGAIVKSNDLLATLVPAEAMSENEAPLVAMKASSSEVTQLPAVRHLLAEYNLEASQIKATGKDGRLTKADVLAVINAPKEAITKPLPSAPKATSIADESGLSGESKNRPERRVAMTRLRARIAERLLQAQRDTAMLTTFNEVNMQPVMDIRKQYKEEFSKKHEIKLGFMSFFVAASVEALKHFPLINASIDGNEVVYHGYFDIGIAISSPRGLVVPILRDADQLSFADIEASISEYAKKANNNKLSMDDLTGGTFSISNGGIFGSLLSTPILNPPQSAILGMHSIQKRPIALEDQVVIRPMMNLALSYDHRIVDGREAVQFLVTIKNVLENPVRLLLQI